LAITDLIGAFAAATAAVAALVGLRYARQSARAAKQATALGHESAEAAQATVRLAEEARKEAERDYERHRLERIGELVEQLFWVSSLEPSHNVDDQFRAKMNLLTQALVGREDSLPDCALVLQAANARYVKDPASKARFEIRRRLQAVESESASR